MSKTASTCRDLGLILRLGDVLCAARAVYLLGHITAFSIENPPEEGKQSLESQHVTPAILLEQTGCSFVELTKIMRSAVSSALPEFDSTDSDSNSYDTTRKHGALAVAVTNWIGQLIVAPTPALIATLRRPDNLAVLNAILWCSGRPRRRSPFDISILEGSAFGFPQVGCVDACLWILRTVWCPLALKSSSPNASEHRELEPPISSALGTPRRMWHAICTIIHRVRDDFASAAASPQHPTASHQGKSDGTGAFVQPVVCHCSCSLSGRPLLPTILGPSPIHRSATSSSSDSSSEVDLEQFGASSVTTAARSNLSVPKALLVTRAGLGVAIDIVAGERDCSSTCAASPESDILRQQLEFLSERASSRGTSASS